MRSLRFLSAALAAVTLAAAAAPAEANVRQMVVFRSGKALTKSVSTRGLKVKVGRKRCAVASRTPLAALFRSHPGRIGLKDFGACSRDPRDATQLFVRSIRLDKNKGRRGWVYKVGRKVSSSGAGDRSGRRLRGGDRLLWFYCRAQRTGGCQRTLEATPDRTAAAPGETVRVTVRGYDDQGRGAAVAGATVRLGSASATTDAAGVAQIAVAGAGRVALTATRAGMVPAFPGEVRAG